MDYLDTEHSLSFRYSTMVIQSHTANDHYIHNNLYRANQKLNFVNHFAKQVGADHHLMPLLLAEDYLLLTWIPPVASTQS